jgi:hypothetical protein
MQAQWPFDDPHNSAALTTTFVLDGAPVLRVYHDYEGGWQFHASDDQPATVEVAKLVSLGSMIDRDASLAALHDLQHGWRAYRVAVGEPWVREKNHPYPTFAEDGFYLENASWMSQYREDLQPPPAEDCDDLPLGMYVKLLFRFAPEDAPRQDYDTERMWVLIAARDEDGNGYYSGWLENDPQQQGDILRAGDRVIFHPLHIAAILDVDSA